MARPEKLKTPLGQRLAAVRKELGYAVRPSFAELLGMPVETLGGYERGIREPDSAFMAMYNRRFGVNITWLVTGDGDMFDDPSKAPRRAIDPNLVRRLGGIAKRVYDAAGISYRPEDIGAEAANIYNDLITHADDITDMAEVESLFDWLEKKARKRLQEAQEAPGNGKRSA